MRYHEVIQANFQRPKRYWAVISAPKFKNSEIYVVTLILKKTVFIPSQVFSGRISSGMGHFSAYRNQRFSLPPTTWGASSLGNFCVPEPGHYFVPPVLKSCISHWFMLKHKQLKPWKWMRHHLIYTMRKIYINSNLETLTKFSSNCRSTEFKDIIPWNISKMITETIPIHTRIVISCEMRRSNPFWVWRKVNGIWDNNMIKISQWREKYCWTNTRVRRNKSNEQDCEKK